MLMPLPTPRHIPLSSSITLGELVNSSTTRRTKTMGGASKSYAIVVPILCCWAAAAVCCVSAKGAAHQHHVGAPAPTGTAPVDCSSALVGLADCLSFVQEGSKEVKPQGQCCSGLKRVVKEEVSCLCQAFAGGADYGVKLNMSKALALPSACGVKTPPFSKCNIAIGAPGAAPVLSPAAVPSASPSFGQSIARAPAPSPMQSTAFSLPAPSLVLTAAAAFIL